MPTKARSISDDRLRAVIGTLSHNRTFTTRDLAEYVRFDLDTTFGQWIDASAIVASLVRRGLIAIAPMLGNVRNDHDVRYYPTADGWTWIERDMDMDNGK